MAERVLGANPIVRIQLQEHAGDHLALDDVVQAREAVAELARSVETCEGGRYGHIWFAADAFRACTHPVCAVCSRADA